MALNQTLGLIAGNERIPFLVLEAVRAQRYEVVIALWREAFEIGNGRAGLWTADQMAAPS